MKKETTYVIIVKSKEQTPVAMKFITRDKNINTKTLAHDLRLYLEKDFEYEQTVYQIILNKNKSPK